VIVGGASHHGQFATPQNGFVTPCRCREVTIPTMANADSALVMSKRQTVIAEPVDIRIGTMNLRGVAP
jgi:hypothetical protein